MPHSEEWKRNWKPPRIKHNRITKWGWMVAYPEKMLLGKYTDIGFGTYINAKYGVVIEEDVEIGSHVSIYSENTIDETWGMVVLRKGCKIGAHSVILPCVAIGENTKVGAFSLVKHDVPPYRTVHGIPAKIT